MSLGSVSMELDQAAFRGYVVRPGDQSYDTDRGIWNGSFDRHPAMIIRCAGVSDVIAAVKFGRASGLPVAVRSGGHSFPGFSMADDALVIDLSLMKGVRVDPERRTARVQAGVLLGDLDRETQAFGLAVPSGIVTSTGVAGLTLGGGIGWIMRKHGLSIDQLILSRCGHRRRRVRAGERRSESRSLLGSTRRRGKLRDSH
jgi:FAD/FMN-containing dehydrogenase